MKSYEVFASLCEIKEVKPYQVAKATGVSTATLTAWKHGEYQPQNDKLQKIADYFEVSLDYLLTGNPTDNEPYYSDAESRDIANFLFENPEYRTLFSAMRNVPPEDLKLVQDMITRLTRKEE